MPRFDYPAARAEGHSDEEIAQYLEQQNAAGADLYIDQADAPGSAGEYGTTVAKTLGTTPEVLGNVTEAYRKAIGAISPMYKAGEYPANAVLGFLGKRVSAGTAALAQPVAEHWPVSLENIGKFAGNIGKGYLLGQPPAGLDPNVPTYNLMRNAGLGPGPAAISALGAEFIGAGPLNDIGALASPAVRGAGTAIRGTAPVQAAAEAVSPATQLFSRTAALTPEEKLVENAALFEGRGIQATKLDEATRLRHVLDAAAKEGAAARLETPEMAASRVVTAKENLARMPAEQALSGLTPKERDAVAQLEVTLGAEPAQRVALGSEPHALDVAPAGPVVPGEQPVGYFPGYTSKSMSRAIGEAGGQVPGAPPPYIAPGGLSTGYGRSRGRQPFETQADVSQRLQTAFPEVQGPTHLPPGEQLVRHAAAEGVRQRNLLVMGRMLKAFSKPAAEAPKGWVSPSGLGNLSGFSDALKAEFAGSRIPPRIHNYFKTWEVARLPENENAILNLRAKVIQGWKPLVTTLSPEFIKRFSGWHFTANFVDQVGAEDYARAMAAYIGKDPETRALLVKARGIGSHGTAADIAGQGLTKFIPTAKLNTAVYDITKSANILKGLRKGLSLQEAAKHADKILLDYSPERFTPFLNAMRRHVSPFLAFSYQIPKAFATLAIEHPGSLGLVHQVVADWNAAHGYTNKEAAGMLPGGEEKGVIVTGQTASGAPEAQRIAGNPFSHINDLFGARGGGLRRRLDAATQLTSPDVSAILQWWSMRSALSGRPVDEQKANENLKYLIPGGLEAPAEALFTKSGRSIQRVKRTLGLAPSDTVDVGKQLYWLNRNRIDKIKAARKAAVRPVAP